MSFKSVKVFDGKISLMDIYLGSEFSKHADKERHDEIFKSIELNGDAKINAVFLVDKEHKNGLEIHVITEAAIIFIINYKTRKLITTKNARVGQLEQYYAPCGLVCPQSIIDKAQNNFESGNNLR